MPRSLLIRAEDKNDWERRAPITPHDLKEILAQSKAATFVEKSAKRAFKEDEYQAAGAAICEGMESGGVIFGVKEIPKEKILDNKVYLFFSHTIKGQTSGMPLLKRIMQSGSTLIDYEKIADAQNRRLIYFGRYAGDAGALDILSLMGEYWEHHGIETPFSAVRRAHQYASVEDAKAHIKAIGEIICEKGLPAELCPMVIGILGYGNVSVGVQQILDCLPNQRVEPNDLKRFVKNGQWNQNTLYLSVFKEEDLVKPKTAKPFDLQDYYKNPVDYESRFEQFLPYTTILINAVYWEKQYPRFVTWDALKRLYEKYPRPKLCGIADITCDTNGSIECNVRSTDSSMPAYLCDPITRSVTDGHKGSGIVVLAVDNLPCELPFDSSTFFSNQLKGFVPNLLAADYEQPLESSGLCPEVQKAVIVHNGRLTPSFAYLKKYL